jgi:hypothetical protein
VTNGTHTEQAPPDGSLPDAQWDAFKKAMRQFKGKQFNIGSLLLDCVQRYIEEDKLVLIFKTRPNMERLQSEMENPDTRRHVQETVERVTGTPYELRLSLAAQGATTAGAPKGHLVRAARAMGAHIVEEVLEEEKPHE